MRVAVTGASGFVASNLIPALMSDGHEVIGLSRSNSLTQENVVRVDYNNLPVLRKALGGIDVIVSLAAAAHSLGHVYSGTKVQSLDYISSNVELATNLSRAAIDVRLPKFIHVSSLGVYGASSHAGAFTEESPFAPADAYAQSKLEAERVLLDAFEHAENNFVILRPPLIYGPECPGTFRMLMKLCRKAPCIPLRGITNPRSFIYVGNFIDAIRECIVNESVRNESYIVTDDGYTSVADIVQDLARLFKRPSWATCYVPHWALGFSARAVGKQDLWRKLSAALHAKNEKFVRATSLNPKVAQHAGLIDTVEAFLRRS